MLYVAVSKYDAVGYDAHARSVEQFGWHHAAARPRRGPSLWTRLRLGERARWELPAYSLRPLESISV